MEQIIYQLNRILKELNNVIYSIMFKNYDIDIDEEIETDKLVQAVQLIKEQITIIQEKEESLEEQGIEE